MKFSRYIPLIVSISIIFFSIKSTDSQVSYNIYIDSVISKVSQTTINKFDKELSGDTITTIGGQPYRIISRQYNHFSNSKATQYIFEKLLSYGLQVEYMPFNTNGVNVIAKKTGTKYPNQKLIICAHYDDMISFGPQSDTVPGADDNASGMCGVLEAARIFSTMSFDYTVIFAAWDEEEVGLFGSKAYADSAFAHGDSIIAVINMDMIAWDLNNDGRFQITSNTNSQALAEELYTTSLFYVPSLVPQVHIGSYGSDHISFNNRGFKGVSVHEDLGDFCLYYHTVNDRFNTLNHAYMYNVIKVVIGAATGILNNYKIYFTHTSVPSSNDTTNILTKAVIKSSWPIAKDANKPRLYYKVGNGSFNYVTAQSNNLDTFYFSIPGQTKGSTVSYYIAAQDSLGTLIGSYPGGARGFNPPGTIPPQSFLVYHINKALVINSTTVPKTLNPMQVTYDTITVNTAGMVNDINLNFTINHSNDSDLYIYLTKEGFSQLPLSTKNGGTGDNYTNTNLDDEAQISITQGTAPFTGTFKPQQSFSLYKDKSMSGKWVIKIFNNSTTVTGQLVSWSINIGYYNPIAVGNISIPVNYSLSQNYPNPFNPVTKIEYSLVTESDIKIVMYDIVGREVRTLADGRLKSGNYSVNFNGSDLASGMYFYSMYVDGVLFDTRKMILMK
ncbi:MAG: M28 family peptidase [Ignavibacteriae bacterium]|nr:MAG: M28 family peptidase [Ignavibacteriota bacterium]